MNNKAGINKAAAARFIDAFNTDGWDTVKQVVAPDYTLTHPIPGTIKLGPEGMVKVWSQDKSRVPDMWHPIPVMITEGDYLAVLLPTYGHFTGESYHGVPATGKFIEYGMVNIVHFKDGKLAEAWFGMDPLVEMQQMGAAPPMPPRQLTTTEKANIDLFQTTVNTDNNEFDNLTAFGDVVVALGPPQYKRNATNRKIEVYHLIKGVLQLSYSHEFTTNPPYTGDPSVDSKLSQALVKRFFNDVLVDHNLDVLAEIVSPNILIHPTAMPCEASYYGINGIKSWLGETWKAFPDLSNIEDFSVTHGDIVAVRWTAKGTSRGNFLMLPPTGKVVEYTGVSMYRIESGKIAEIWEARNTFGIMNQLNPKMGDGHPS